MIGRGTVSLDVRVALMLLPDDPKFDNASVGYQAKELLNSYKNEHS